MNQDFEGKRMELAESIRYLQNQMAFASNLLKEELDIILSKDGIDIVKWNEDSYFYPTTVASFNDGNELFDFLTNDPESELKKLL